MNKIKIVHTPVRFYPEIGGVENHVYYLSTELVKQNFDVEVICAGKKNPIDYFNGIKITRLNYLFKITNTNIALTLPYKLLTTKFDIIHTHMPTPWFTDWSILIAKLKRKKSILTIHNDMDKPDFFGKLVTKIYLNTIFKLSLSLVDQIIIVNPTWGYTFYATKNILKKYIHKISVIPNGINKDLFKPINKHHKENNTLLFVSILDTHHKFKGLDILLNSIVEVKRHIPNVILNIIGDGELKKYYQDLSHKLKINNNVKFLNKIEQKDLPHHYNRASVFVLPSTEIEGFGIVLLEAMACEVPVITTSIAGTSRDIIKFKTGIVIEPNSSSKLANAILKLLKNQELSIVFARNGRNLIKKRYDWTTVTKQIIKFYADFML